MADKGFTQYPHWLEHELMNANLNGREFKVLICIIRKTFGYNRKSDKIAYTQISDDTGIARNHCVEIVKSLETKGWIKVRRVKKGINTISLAKGVPQNGTKGVPKNRTERIPKMGTTKQKVKEQASTDLTLGESVLEEIKDWEEELGDEYE